jgi:enoyl-CoA hydratase
VNNKSNQISINCVINYPNMTHPKLTQILYSQTNGILRATINRPEKLNALNFQVIDELQSLFNYAASTGIKGVILTGAGEKAFVAGADIKELSSLSQDQALNLALKGQKLFKQIEDMPKPVIAAINGFALGGGCELAMACHIRIATENARFGQPEVNLGIIPGYGGTQRLTQLVGRGKALELMLTADLISAQEAKTLGLVNHVVISQQELTELAEKIMNKIIGKGPIAVANVIKSVNEGFSFEHAGYAAEARFFAECAVTTDFKEGTSAFLEKRQANFKGE